MTPKELTDQRGKDYGHPREDFTRTAIMWSAILNHPVRTEDVPLMMIALKISREVHKHKSDNLDDIQGYAETSKMLHE
jgi:hypothetical protein